MGVIDPTGGTLHSSLLLAVTACGLCCRPYQGFGDISVASSFPRTPSRNFDGWVLLVPRTSQSRAFLMSPAVEARTAKASVLQTPAAPSVILASIVGSEGAACLVVVA